MNCRAFYRESICVLFATLCILCSAAAVDASLIHYQRDNTMLLRCTVDGKDGEHLYLNTPTLGYDTILNITKNTLLLDAASGEPISLRLIRDDMNVLAYVTPASKTPWVTGQVVLSNLPTGFPPPVYGEIQKIIPRPGGGLDALIPGDTALERITLHIDQNTGIDTYRTGNVLSMTQLRPGDRVLCWYEGEGRPDASPTELTPMRVMVFPYQYEGYLSVTQEGIFLNGQPLELAPHETPWVIDADGRRHLMVPIRRFAEALGCQVEWRSSDNRVVVRRDGEEIYRFHIGQAYSVRAWGEGPLLETPTAFSGVTFLAIDNLIEMHGLKLAEP